jgi:hypothetical protein
MGFHRFRTPLYWQMVTAVMALWQSVMFSAVIWVGLFFLAGLHCAMVIAWIALWRRQRRINQPA